MAPLKKNLAALSLALLVGCSSQPNVSPTLDAGDDAPVNPAEKQAYRRLLEALNLPDAEVAEAEWAARRELEQKRSMLEVIGMALAGWGAWPALDVEGGSLPPGYWL